MRRVTVLVLLAGISMAVTANEFSGAKKLGAPNTQLMGCPDGAFWDPRNGGECWTCGNGQRTVNPVTSDRACLVPPRTSFAPATRLEANKTTCSDGSFLDIGKGTCWSCPSGTSRTAFPVDGSKACSKRVARQNRKATYVYKTGSLLKACRKGTFANVGSQSCYSCPKGWNHDPSRKVKTNGVCYKPAKTNHYAATESKDFSLSCSSGFYDPIDKGSCWQCPDNYIRQVSSVKSDKACMRVTKPVSTAARKIRDHSPTIKEVAVGVSNLGCGEFGGSAFFDLKDGGSCWSCPGSHPQRTLYAVDTGKACATKTCGVENGRPCYLWERIPSCNAGLAEDPFKGQCVRPKNLACTTYVNTLKRFYDIQQEAQRRGTAVAEGALSKVPGAEAFTRFALNSMGQVQETLNEAMPTVNFEGIATPYTEFLQDNAQFIDNYLRTVSIVAEQRQKFTAMMLDADLMCSGDAKQLARRFADTGLHDAFRSVEPDPGPTVIRMGQTGFVGHPAAMLGSLGGPLAMSPVVGPGSRNRLILDFSMDFPGELFGIKGFKGVLSPGLQIAIALDSLVDGEHSVSFVFGGYAGGAQETPDSIKDLIKDNTGAINFGVGLQLGGPERYANDGCHNSGVLSGGIAIKTKYMGFGFNPTCPLLATFSGFSVNVGAMNLGELKTFTETVGQLAAGSGTVPVAQAPWTQPRFSRAYPTRQILGGGEVVIRVLPWAGKTRVGATF